MTKKYEITNLYVYGWESDYLAITKADVAYEIEIKISKADFKNDVKNKTDKHLLLEGGKILGRFNRESGLPNYFYYAVPEGLIDVDDVPEYAGLLYLNPWGISFIKQPKKLTEDKFDVEKLRLVDKFYYNMLSWQRKYEEVINSADELKDLKRQIRAYQKDIIMYEEMLEKKDEEIDILEDEIKRRSIENSKGNVPEK